MDKEITLALLTPRSGELNYRYLIPEGVSYNDMKLGEIRNQLERSEKDRPGLLLQCEARQLGGRMGTEALIFYVPEFQRYPQDDQKQCRELLQDWFENKRDAVIQTIDWSAHPNTQTIAIPELTQLKNQLSAILSKPEKIDSTSRAVTTGISSFFKHFLYIMIALTLVILLISAPGIQFGDIYQKIRQNLTGESSVQEQEQELLKQLEPYEKMFQFPDGTNKPTIKNYKEDAFDALYRYCKKDTLNPIDKYLQDNYVQNIEKQQGANQFPIFGDIPEESELNNVKGISPVQLRRILATYKKLQVVLSNESENPVFSSTFVRIDYLSTNNADILLNPTDKTAQPKFFVQYGSAKELDWALTVRNFIFSIIKDNQNDKIVTELKLSQKNLVELIGYYTLFKNIECKNDELQGAFNEFCNVLEGIANETNADKTKN